MRRKDLDLSQDASTAFRNKEVLRVCSSMTKVPETLLIYASKRFMSKSLEEILSLFIVPQCSVPLDICKGSCITIKGTSYFSLWKYCTKFFCDEYSELIIRSLLFDTKASDMKGTAPLRRLFDGRIEDVVFEYTYGKHYNGFLRQYFDKITGYTAPDFKSQSSYGKVELVGYSVKKNITSSHKEPSKGKKFTNKTKGDYGYLYKDVIYDSLDDLCAELGISIRVLTSYSYLWKRVYNMYDVSSAVRLCLSGNGTRTYQSIVLDDLADGFGLNTGWDEVVKKGYLNAELLG